MLRTRLTLLIRDLPNRLRYFSHSRLHFLLLINCFKKVKPVISAYHHAAAKKDYFPEGLVKKEDGVSSMPSGRNRSTVKSWALLES